MKASHRENHRGGNIYYYPRIIVGNKHHECKAGNTLGYDCWQSARKYARKWIKVIEEGKYTLEDFENSLAGKLPEGT